jgi:outer membrane lipoprotein-sorting protein
MIQRFFYIILFYLFSFSAQSKDNSELAEKINNKFATIKNIKFDFTQKIGDTVEIGTCFLEYPKKLICRYKGDEQKEIVIKENTLAIIKRKYQRVYYYRVTNSPFATILDKEKIISQISNIKNISSKNGLLVLDFYNDDKSSYLQLFLNKVTLDIEGWENTGYDQQTTNFTIKNSQINIDFNEKFEIPDFDLGRNQN